MGGLDRRSFAIGSAGLIASARALPATANKAETPADANVLRVQFEAAETGFDPAQVSDLYSNRVNAHIFEAPLGYDPLAVPVRLVPVTAEALPEASADHTVWTVRLQRGILEDFKPFQITNRVLIRNRIGAAKVRARLDRGCFRLTSSAARQP